jgi:hypothetical protein
MLVKVFTKDDGPESRQARELGIKLETEGYDVEYYDADDQKSTADLELFDVYSFPTFVVTENDGMEVECWRGTVPLESDIKMFLQQ